MYHIEDAGEGEPGFVKATYVRQPPKLYEVGDGDEGTILISGERRIWDFLPDRFYRGYFIYRDPPPIPDRRFDVGFYHFDYDGPGDLRAGRSDCERNAKKEIDLLIEDERD